MGVTVSERLDKRNAPSKANWTRRLKVLSKWISGLPPPCGIFAVLLRDILEGRTADGESLEVRVPGVVSRENSDTHDHGDEVVRVAVRFLEGRLRHSPPGRGAPGTGSSVLRTSDLKQHEPAGAFFHGLDVGHGDRNAAGVSFRIGIC